MWSCSKDVLYTQVNGIPVDISVYLWVAISSNQPWSVLFSTVVVRLQSVSLTSFISISIFSVVSLRSFSESALVRKISAIHKHVYITNSHLGADKQWYLCQYLLDSDGIKLNKTLRNPKYSPAVVHEYPRTDKNTANENTLWTFGLILNFSHITLE